MSTVRIDLSFAALATRGHQIVWMRVHQPEHDMTTEAVLDATSGTVYCDEKMFGLFAHAAAASDPLAVATQRGWQLQEKVEGSVTCAVVATSSADRGASVRTTLFVDTTVHSPYRWDLRQVAPVCVVADDLVAAALLICGRWTTLRISMEIREATPTDAANLVAYLKELVAEPGISIPMTPEDVPSIDQERVAIDTYSQSERALMLLALGDAQIVGELSIKAISPRRAIAHVATLGMSVRQSWRRKGVGRELLSAAIEWAPTAGIKRIELYVYARNEAAIKLYEATGFTHEGRRRGFIREGDAYLDDLVMAKWLD